MTTITNPDGQKLLMQIADLFDLNPELHMQKQWETACGTRACIAGWTCILGTDDFEAFPVEDREDVSAYAPIDGVIERGIEMSDEVDRDWLRRRWDSMQTEVHYQDMPLLTKRVSMLANTAYYPRTATDLLGLSTDDYMVLFGANCEPLNGLTVPEALREMARGAEIESVWGVPAIEFSEDQPS